MFHTAYLYEWAISVNERAGWNSFFCKRNVRNPTTVRIRLQVEQFKNAVNKPETARRENSGEAACIKTQFANE